MIALWRQLGMMKPVRGDSHVLLAIADPKDVNCIYVMEVVLILYDDGGRTLRRLGEKSKHVDNHDIWVINPNNTEHYLVVCDGDKMKWMSGE